MECNHRNSDREPSVNWHKQIKMLSFGHGTNQQPSLQAAVTFTILQIGDESGLHGSYVGVLFMQKLHVTVLCANQRLYHCILYHHIQSTAPLNFGGVHMQYIDTSHIHAYVKCAWVQPLTHYTLKFIFYKSFWGYWYLAWAVSSLLLSASTGNFS